MFEPKIETFIRCCTMHKNTKAMENLLSDGVNINEFGTCGRTALMEVCWLNAGASIVRFLIKNGADVKQRTATGETAMIMLGRSQKPYNIVEEVLCELINNGANIDECDNQGCTALHNAALNLSNPEIIKAFIKHGANLQKPNNIQISPAEQILHTTKDAAIAEACLRLLPNVKGLLLAFITNSRMADFSGNWNQKNVEECIKIFLQKGVDINYQDKQGMTALMYFCENNSQDNLLKAGTCFLGKMLRQPNQKNVAEVIKILVKNGADTKLKNSHNKTAFDLCADKKELCEALLLKQ